MNQIILPITEKQTVENYPYGQKKTTIYYSIDFHPKKGFRYVSQTINPKNNRLNKPHPDTYGAFVYLYKNPENGHIKNEKLEFSGYDDIHTNCEFLARHFNTLSLTEEMIKYLYKLIDKAIYGNAIYTRADKEKLKALLAPAFKALTHGLKTGENVFNQIKIDWIEIDKLEEEFRNP